MPERANGEISRENGEALARLEQQLTLKAYSASTIKTYRNEFRQFLSLLKSRPASTLTPEDLRRYLQ
jgi:integrase/recombinase XerD